jgi:hypothetical protein
MTIDNLGHHLIAKDHTGYGQVRLKKKYKLN